MSFGISHSTRTSLPRDRRPRRHRPTAREHPLGIGLLRSLTGTRKIVPELSHDYFRPAAMPLLVPSPTETRGARWRRGGPRYTPRPPHTSLRKKMTGLRLHSASTAANSPGAESNRLDPHTSAHHGQSDIELPWLIDTQIKNEIHNFTSDGLGPEAYYQAGNRARHASVWQEYLSITAGSHKLTRTMAVPLTPIPLDRFGSG